MRDYSKIIELSEKNNGYVFSKDITENKIPKDYLKFAVKDGIIEKVAYGIYMVKDNFIDNLFVFQKINSKVIYSAFTSAYLLELTTRDSGKIFASVPLDYNSKKIFNGNTILREPKDLYLLGLTKVTTNFGNEIVCHDIHRTVCDLFNPKYVGDKFVQVEALKTYLRRGDKNTLKLMQYAKKLGVDKAIRERLEVLL
ncbi:MAG: type IV toxin-antitoxin system AbiEi family antitoxin domain-containing protein [Clostridia bacterium]